MFTNIIKIGDSGNLQIQVDIKNCNIVQVNIIKNGKNTLLKKNLEKLLYLDTEGDKCVIKLGKLVICEGKNIDTFKGKDTLTANEIRVLCMSNLTGYDAEDMFVRSKNQLGIKTDLHTHLAGVLPAETLVEIGKKNNVKLLVSKLHKIGIKDIYNKSSTISINELSKEQINRIIEKMSISPYKQETFIDMERVYDVRRLFTKKEELFKDIIYEIGKYYESYGVEYVELSRHNVVNREKDLEEFREVMNRLSNEGYNVKMRLLGALWRHSPLIWNMDEADRLISIAKSKYIAGIDFMGHEINSTDNFKDVIRYITNWSIKNDPDFVIRVHAGENPIFKNNIKIALKIIDEEHRRLEESDLREYKYPKIRIGHGLYGVDKEVIDLCKKMNVIVEFNFTSNMALNNVNEIKDNDILQEYISNGVSVVLGTDGGGIYHTNPKEESYLIRNKEIIDCIRVTEDSVINSSLSKMDNDFEDVYLDLKKVSYDTVNNNRRCTEQEALKIYMDKERYKERLVKKNISSIGAITDKELIINSIKDKIPILLMGASKSGWEKISNKGKENIFDVIYNLVDKLDEEKVYFITGGVNHGVDKILHQIVNECNKDFVVLGMYPLQSYNEDFESNTITHGMIASMYGVYAKTWQEVPDIMLSKVQNEKGSIITIGGGPIVSDTIQRVINTYKIDMHMMYGPEGASTEKIKMLRDKEYRFDTAEELINKLSNANSDILKEEYDYSI